MTTNTMVEPTLIRQAATETIALVGGGIVNLITAHYLNAAGYAVKVFDRSPDPATRPHWRLLGCSLGGGDSRIFSINESRHHLVNSRHYGIDGESPFRRTIPQGGWLALPPSGLNATDLDWIARFESVSRELAGQFNQDIISFNRESEPLWRDMIAEKPDLFRRAGFRAGLYRVYATEEKFARARSAEEALGTIKRVLSPADVVKDLPALQDAFAADNIAGALEVTGFSVNIHALMEQLISDLSSRGVQFGWNTRIIGIERDAKGQVKALRSAAGNLEAKHYVLSTGVYSQHLLDGFASAQAMAPVIGLWLTVPNLSPTLDLPLKITRKGFASDGAAEGANVVPGVDDRGRPVIHVSSGHGYIGFGNESKAYEDMMELGRAVEETARDFFPKGYLSDYSFDRRDESYKRYCIRPWTASGLGIFESSRTHRDGRFIITGGHNTGGFAQAPATAMAVLASIERRNHPMHALYHPLRLEDLVTGVSHVRQAAST